MECFSVRKFGPMLLVFLGLCGGSLLAGDAAGTNAADMVPLVLKLPAAHYAGTPPQGTTFSGIQDTPDPTVKIPKGVKNIAPQAKLTCSAKSITRARIGQGHRWGQGSGGGFRRGPAQGFAMDPI